MKTLTTLPRVYVSDDTFPHSFGDLAALSEEIRRLQVQRYALEVADMFSHGVHALSFDRDENGCLYLTVRYDAAPTKYFSSGEDPHFDVELDPSDIEDAVDWAMLYPHLPGRGDLLSDSLPVSLRAPLMDVTRNIWRNARGWCCRRLPARSTYNRVSNQDSSEVQ